MLTACLSYILSSVRFPVTKNDSKMLLHVLFLAILSEASKNWSIRFSGQIRSNQVKSGQTNATQQTQHKTTQLSVAD